MCIRDRIQECLQRIVLPSAGALPVLYDLVERHIDLATSPQTFQSADGRHARIHDDGWSRRGLHHLVLMQYPLQGVLVFRKFLAGNSTHRELENNPINAVKGVRETSRIFRQLVEFVAGILDKIREACARSMSKIQCRRPRDSERIYSTFVEVFPFQQQDEAFDEMSSRTPLF